MRWQGRNKYDWHPFFVIMPIKIQDTWCWFEWVERKVADHDYHIQIEYFRIIIE